MKKVLALVLAVMMLATVAFAVVENPEAGGTTYSAEKRPGDTLTITDSGIVTAKPDVYVLSKDKTEGDNKIAVKNLNSTNYSISNIKYVDGKNLLDGTPKFNDAKDQLEIKLKNDYNNTKASNLEITFTLKGKKVGKGEKPANIDVKISYTVGYHLVKNVITLDSGSADLKDVDFTKKENIYQVAGPDNYGTLEFTAVDGDTDIEVRVYKDDKLYLYNDIEADSDILKKYADTDADITFLNFPNTSFNATATVRFYQEEGTYIYENKEGNLTPITAEAASAGAAGQTAGKVKWDEDEGCYILKTRSLAKTYVFSDKALPVDAADDTTNGGNVTNPDTGANDVVGIATALAAVALVSAAAVSLKK